MSITMKYKASSGITPIEYNVVVKPEKVEEQTKGGLYIPDSSHDTDQHGHQRGIIDAVGDIHGPPLAVSLRALCFNQPR